MRNNDIRTKIRKIIKHNYSKLKNVTSKKYLKHDRFVKLEITLSNIKRNDKVDDDIRVVVLKLHLQ